MSTIIARGAAAPIRAVADSLDLAGPPPAADATAAEPSTGFHPDGGGQGSGTTEGQLSPGGVIAQIFALELERRGIKLNLEQTAAKLGIEMPPTDCTAK
jgi:hypothetical protein